MRCSFRLETRSLNAGTVFLEDTRLTVATFVWQGFRDDSIESRASQLQKSIGFGDACTYRLIARNVVNLLTQSQQQLKDSTLKSLDELIK